MALQQRYFSGIFEFLWEKQAEVILNVLNDVTLLLISNIYSVLICAQYVPHTFYRQSLLFLSMSFSQRPTGTLVVKQVGFITCSSKGEHTPWGSVGCLRKRMAEGSICTLLGWFGEGSKKKQGFTLSWMCCWKVGVFLWLGISINLFMGRRAWVKGKAAMDEEAGRHSGREKGCLLFCGWHIDFLFA